MPFEEFKKKYEQKMFLLVALIIFLSASAVIIFFICLVHDEKSKEIVKDYQTLFAILFGFIGYLMNRLIQMEKNFLKDTNISIIEYIFYPAALLSVSAVLLSTSAFPWAYIIGIVLTPFIILGIETFFLAPLREDRKKTKEYLERKNPLKGYSSKK